MSGNGNLTVYYDNGQKEYELSFLDGKENGIVKGWYKSGTLQFEYYMNKGEYEGKLKQWYENGILKGETDYFFLYLTMSQVSFLILLLQKRFPL